MLALLPNGTTVEELGAVPSIAPGLLSAGLGQVAPAQTYLDITQGSRIFNSLYDDELPQGLRPVGTRVPGWGAIVARAESAPADIVPGLLAGTVSAEGARGPRGSATEAALGLATPAVLATDPEGRVDRLPPRCAPFAPCAPPLSVHPMTIDGLAPSIERMGSADLLIALERPPPEERRALALGMAAVGLRGNLTSASTRMDGYVLSTDLAPTILERLGIAPPQEMTGEPIRAEGEPDPAAVASLGERLGDIAPRRGTVIGLSVLAWLLVLAAAIVFSRRRLAPVALQLLALSAVYLPLTLLAGALLRPGEEAIETLLVLAGAPALAAATLALAPGWRALALACGATTVAYAADVIAGSPLTSLSLMGPNPGLGVRFYGIGNELEATLAPIVLVGTGAALAALGARPGKRGAAVFLAVGLLAAFVFAAGRFGADVGAAIVFPVGGACAAALLSGRRPSVLIVAAVPLAALAVLAAIDLLSGGNAHLTSSVLEAGGLSDLAEVAERRLRLSARSFVRAATGPFLPLAILVIALAVWQRQRVLMWIGENPAVRAGFLGAAAATAIGTLANDSGALLLEVGTGYLLVLTGFAWAESGR
jgi:hypothetical protein